MFPRGIKTEKAWTHCGQIKIQNWHTLAEVAGNSACYDLVSCLNVSKGFAEVYSSETFRCRFGAVSEEYTSAKAAPGKPMQRGKKPLLWSGILAANRAIGAWFNADGFGRSRQCIVDPQFAVEH